MKPDELDDDAIDQLLARTSEHLHAETERVVGDRDREQVSVHRSRRTRVAVLAVVVFCIGAAAVVGVAVGFGSSSTEVRTTRAASESAATSGAAVSSSEAPTTVAGRQTATIWTCGDAVPSGLDGVDLPSLTERIRSAVSGQDLDSETAKVVQTTMGDYLFWYTGDVEPEGRGSEAQVILVLLRGQFPWDGANRAPRPGERTAPYETLTFDRDGLGLTQRHFAGSHGDLHQLGPVATIDIARSCPGTSSAKRDSAAENGQ